MTSDDANLDALQDRLTDEILWVVHEARALATLAGPERGARKAAYERRKAYLADLLEQLPKGAYQPGEVDEWLRGFDEITEAIQEAPDAVRYRIAATDLHSEPVIVAGVAFRRVEARDSDAPGWSTDHE